MGCWRPAFFKTVGGRLTRNSFAMGSRCFLASMMSSRRCRSTCRAANNCHSSELWSVGGTVQSHVTLPYCWWVTSTGDRCCTTSPEVFIPSVQVLLLECTLWPLGKALSLADDVPVGRFWQVFGMRSTQSVLTPLCRPRRPSVARLTGGETPTWRVSILKLWSSGDVSVLTSSQTT